ncbi:MAG: dihydroorotase [Nitrospirota bacterium]
MSIIIKGGRVIDPVNGVDGIQDVYIEGNKIIQPPKTKKPGGAEIIDADGLIVAPGLIDMHCHLRDPGFEYKEDIASGTRAAAAGGFTTICCMPNTNPINDSRSVTEFIISQADKAGFCKVMPIGAITKGSMGTELAEMGEMAGAGCVGFSDDGKPVANAEMMRHALEYSKTFNRTIISHCEESALSAGGVMNEGAVSTRLGLRGIPAAAEEVMVARDISLARLTGARLHIAHVSTAGSVELIRRAKAEGITVTAETCPHYFTLTEEGVMSYNTYLKVNPPLRTEADRKAIIGGLSDGTIDVIATDHAPHAASEKDVEFDLAPFGISGLETALALSMALAHSGLLSMAEMLKKLTLNPARALGLALPSLSPGSVADIVLIDPVAVKTVRPETLISKGKNTAFSGLVLKGWPVGTIHEGKRIAVKS